MSRSLIETAEQLIVLKPQHLDADDQALHGAYERVSKDDDQPVAAAALRKAGQHQHHLHHGRMADREGADTDEGKRIGK